MDQILKKYPAPQLKTSLLPPSGYAPDLLLDLHGYTQDEALKKLEWIRENIDRAKWKKIRIVTGKGTGALFFLLCKQLKLGFFEKNKMHSFTVLAGESGVEILFL